MVTALLVEDNVAFRESLKETLALPVPGDGVTEAGDGEEALRKIEACVPDLIFMDIKLPGENGLSLTKKNQSRLSRCCRCDLNKLRSSGVSRGCLSLSRQLFYCEGLSQHQDCGSG